MMYSESLELLIILHNGNLYSLTNVSLLPPPSKPLATTILLFASMTRTILDFLFIGYHIAFVVLCSLFHLAHCSPDLSGLSQKAGFPF